MEDNLEKLVKDWGGKRKDSGRKKGITGREMIKKRLSKNDIITESEVRERFRIINEKFNFYKVRLSQESYPDIIIERNDKLIYAEVETKSSHFRQHKHNPDDCDMIICWEHDWSDCFLPVLEISVLWEKLKKIEKPK